VFNRGLILTAQAIRRQLAAMPHELYLIRLIHCLTKRLFPGERLWTADQLTNLATIRFLRARNREGCSLRCSSTRCKHLRKKSISSAWRPTFRSRSAT